MKTYLTLLAVVLCASLLPAQSPSPSGTKTAVFAGGCFWCIQPPFDKTPGVVQTVVGYTGGKAEDATYEKVSSETTQHRESIQVTYDPGKVSYGQLLDVFWRNIDPTQADGQFYDIGPSYHAAIYYGNGEEKKIAEASKAQLAGSGKFKKPIVTEILPATPFYPAEDYHQKYSTTHPTQYDAYHSGSGRNSFFDKVWQSPSPKK